MILIKMLVKWKSVSSSDAPNCDESNNSFRAGEARLLGEDENRNQFIIHTGCRRGWETRTGVEDITNR